MKNIIFTVAQMQKADPEKALYLLLEGTDHLEGLFGDCRTQDHSRNFDIEQPGQKLGVATLIHSAMQHNPDLNMGHRHLSLKNSIGIDHINPKSWRGTVKVGDVDLNVTTRAGSILMSSFQRKIMISCNLMVIMLGSTTAQMMLVLKKKILILYPTTQIISQLKTQNCLKLRQMVIHMIISLVWA